MGASDTIWPLDFDEFWSKNISPKSKEGYFKNQPLSYALFMDFIEKAYWSGIGLGFKLGKLKKGKI